MTEFVKEEPEPRLAQSSDALVKRTICVSPEMTKSLDQLVHMHEFRRPSRSKTERKFINEFIVPTGAKPDKFGNYRLIVPMKDGSASPVLWASHTDTVHHHKGMQEVGFDKMEIGLTDYAMKHHSNCLGADDTAGVWVMLELLRHNVPGTYIFHREEEGGRGGSRWIAAQEPETFKDIKFAIALDRKGTTSIITHQMGTRCCSDDFQKSLTAQLGMGYKGDEHGSYTDTASYVDLVGECTNLSVGYRNAHGSDERLELDHVFKLRDALIMMDQTELVSSRKPGEKESRVYHYSDNYKSMGAWGGSGASRYPGYYDEWQDWDDQHPTSFNGVHHTPGMKGTDSGKRVGSGVTSLTGKTMPEVDDILDAQRRYQAAEDDKSAVEQLQAQDEQDAMCRIIKANPEAVAEVLLEYGIGFDELCDEIQSISGTIHLR